MKNYLRSAAAVSIWMSALVFTSCNTSWSPAVETDASKYELRGAVVSLRSVPYKVDSTEDGYRLGELDPFGRRLPIMYCGLW